MPQTLESDMKLLADKAGIKVEALSSPDGTPNFNAIDNAMKEFSAASKDNFKFGTRLPIPNSLKKMLSRDSKVAENAFKMGERTATYNAELAKQSRQVFHDSIIKSLNNLTNKETSLYPFY